MILIALSLVLVCQAKPGVHDIMASFKKLSSSPAGRAWTRPGFVQAAASQVKEQERDVLLSLMRKRAEWHPDAVQVAQDVEKRAHKAFNEAKARRLSAVQETRVACSEASDEATCSTLKGDQCSGCTFDASGMGCQPTARCDVHADETACCANANKAPNGCMWHGGVCLDMETHKENLEAEAEAAQNGGEEVEQSTELKMAEALAPVKSFLQCPLMECSMCFKFGEDTTVSTLMPALAGMAGVASGETEASMQNKTDAENMAFVMNLQSAVPLTCDQAKVAIKTGGSCEQSCSDFLHCDSEVECLMTMKRKPCDGTCIPATEDEDIPESCVAPTPAGDEQEWDFTCGDICFLFEATCESGCDPVSCPAHKKSETLEKMLVEMSEGEGGGEVSAELKAAAKTYMKMETTNTPTEVGAAQGRGFTLMLGVLALVF